MALLARCVITIMVRTGNVPYRLMCLKSGPQLVALFGEVVGPNWGTD